ncbi:Na+/H+ antiporter [Marinicrinis sediminis]|uniref:Na+/H+ antiporter n=1 Tax=Marinicrinis sediminis TaxID=1652465 RepID=A0ABW5R630_9BACL
MEHQFELILILLAIAAGITALSQKIKIPYPIALVLGGAAIGLLPIPALDPLKAFFVEDEVFRFAIISIFLPALLGEATLKLPFGHLRENARPILSLAFIGTLISYVAVGFMAIYFLDLPTEAAFVFAALMAATDPVSVLSIFKSLGVNHRLATIMEGESLVNDGIAVVLFKISHLSLAAYVAAGIGGVGSGTVEFLKVAIGGLVIGAILAYVFAKISMFFDDYPLEIIFSLILLYGSFFIAEKFHVSGVIAVVTAGLIFGNYGSKIAMSPTTKLNTKTFWEVLALLSNSLVFLLVGLEIARIDMTDKWGLIGLAIVIVLIGRSLAVYSSLLLIRNLPANWKHVFNWGGLKGSLSIALALSLPVTFEGRDDVLVLAFGVVLFSLIVQGLSIKPFVRWLKVSQQSKESSDYANLIAELQRSQAARDAIRKMMEQATISKVIYDQMDAQYETAIQETRGKLEALYADNPQLRAEQWRTASSSALYAQYDAIKELQQKHIIDEATASKHYTQIIEKLAEKEEAQEKTHHAGHTPGTTGASQ